MATNETKTSAPRANPAPIVEMPGAMRDSAAEVLKAQKAADLQVQRVLVEATKAKEAEDAGKKAEEDIAAKALKEAQTAVAADDKVKAEEKAKLEKELAASKTVPVAPVTPKATASTPYTPIVDDDDGDDDDEPKGAKSALPKGGKK